MTSILRYYLEISPMGGGGRGAALTGTVNPRNAGSSSKKAVNVTLSKPCWN